jgi:hypothetical protein
MVNSGKTTVAGAARLFGLHRFSPNMLTNSEVLKKPLKIEQLNQTVKMLGHKAALVEA